MSSPPIVALSPPYPRPFGVHHSAIRIPGNRQRLEVSEEALGELAASIAAIGLLHPVVIREDANGYVLVAGERRLKAIRLMSMTGRGVQVGSNSYPAGDVPVTLLGDLTPEQAHEAELEENIRRVDLSLAERVRAIKALHDLRSAQKPDHTVRDTAQEAYRDLHPDRARQKVWAALAIATAMETNPAVAKAKTENEAMKLINRATQRELNERVAAVVGKISKHELHEVYNADAQDWLADCEPGRFNCILIDPPYGMDASEFGDAAGRLSGIAHHYSDTPASFRTLMENIAHNLTRVARSESHLYIWCDIDGFHFLRDLFTRHNWWCFRTPLVNVKREGGRVPWPEHGPRRCYELVFYAVRGKLQTTAIYRDVFESTLVEGNAGHGAQKPVEAYVELLRRSTNPGEIVLDCFAGTGTILAAAHQLRLRSVAVELDPAAYGMCVKRLEELE